MKNISQMLGRKRIFVNVIRGAGTGLIIWILQVVVYRMFGQNSPYFQKAGDFMLGGMIIGAIIGMISLEILWHKEKHQSN